MKKLISILLVVALACIGLASCGSDIKELPMYELNKLYKELKNRK